MEKLFLEMDSYLFHHGTHYELYNKMGAHLTEENGVKGVHFVLWAPHAQKVCVISDGNGWTHWKDNMVRMDESIWELFIPGMTEGTRYKYRILRSDGVEVDKTDPYGFQSELRPSNASIVCDLSKYVWHDEKHLEKRSKENFITKPMAVYEVHLGSWKRDYTKRDPHDPDLFAFLDYRTLAHQIADYMEYMGYTHVELLGICEYPFDPSWGYQVTGYYAPTARYGTFKDFMYFVDYMHQRGFGVILDWVPAHFPKDEFSLSLFDGTPLYEFADPLRGEFPEWGTKAFDLGKNEVINFLIASALFWINVYHIDGLRVDAVASMLYNHFGRSEWRPNKDGGVENYEGYAFIKHLTSIVHKRTSGIIIAEDSSVVAGITTPPEQGGFGFDLKWNMGWMNDSVRYFNIDPIYRKYHHDLITHTFDYVFSEQFILVLSHDEVVYGKGSMLNKMSGNFLDKLGCLKSFYTMMMGNPGKKLLFMGQDFAQPNEWDYRKGLDWYLTDRSAHRDVMETFRTLLSIYKEREVLYNDYGKDTFEWISSRDADRSIFSFIRRTPWNYDNALIFVCNFNPVYRDGYAIGAPRGGKYRRIFSTYRDARGEELFAQERLCDGRPYAIPYNLRPFESIILEICPEPEKEDKAQTVATNAIDEMSCVQIEEEKKAQTSAKKKQRTANKS